MYIWGRDHVNQRGSMDPESGRSRISFLVADAGPFIKGAPLQKWSDNVVTVREVLSEIRDKATRERLQVLPYDLAFKEPSTEALQHVTRFAKKTGDYGSLSPVDIKLISLTYQLHCELDPLSVSQLRQDPLKQKAAGRVANGPVTVGFYLPSKKNQKDSRPQSTTNETHSDSCHGSSQEREVERVEEMRLEETGTRLEQAVLEVPETEASGKAGEDTDSDDDDDDDEGWITPENLRQVCEEMGGVLDELPQSLPVGCITTDFAMQNVILQMGLNLISVEGKMIKQMRTYAKKCKGCFKTTTNTGLEWCPWCGNRSLYRVSVVVDRTGRMQYRPLSNKQFSHKGLRYPLPVPKSGRHAHNPVLAPDQQVTYKERRRRENRLDPLDLDYVTQSSPFAFHDVTSRGAKLAVRGGGANGRCGNQRRNPNAVRPKGMRKK